MKSEFSRQILEKYSKIKFYQNPSSGSRVIRCGERQTDNQTDRQPDRQTDRQPDRQTDNQTVRQPDRQTDGRTDRHDEANSRFRSSANTPKVGNSITWDI